MTQLAEPAGPTDAFASIELSPDHARAPLPLNEVGRPSLWSSRELIANLTRREVAGKYKRTALGQIWSLINPLATMLVYTLVFSVIFKIKPDTGNPSGLKNYALALMCGLLPWSFFNTGVSTGMNALVFNANLVLKVYFRRDAVVIAQVFSLVVTFLFELLVLTVAILCFGAAPLEYLPGVVVAVGLLTLFTLGLALLLSVANVYFRDTTHFISIVFQLLFYLSPVIYPISRVAATLNKHRLLGVKFSTLYQLNPITRFVEAFRTLLYDNRWPPVTTDLYCVVSALVMLGIGSLVFSRFEGRLAEEL